ncbi:MAG: DUF397 domain-containing protein [Actinophytocola sp.]|uniref:DUF397 domain-containing protein n=1 Tax=Actinophytocola sp. TaxID=1872138 RepID=UPI00132701EF|nr:DUF397 domain-containing protein [Actinophytocola sp.]MPZ82609.1 DUF397 domain-containing protein [Actinophytocola sp.]
MGAADLVFKKSSYSGGNGECVEVAFAGAIRDSKNPDGPSIRVQLDALVDSVKSGRLDH